MLWKQGRFGDTLPRVLQHSFLCTSFYWMCFSIDIPCATTATGVWNGICSKLIWHEFHVFGSEWLPCNRKPLETELQEFEDIDGMGKPSGERSEPLSEPENKRPQLSLSLKRKKTDVDWSSLQDSTSIHRQFGSPKV